MTTQDLAKSIFTAAQPYLDYLNYDHNLDCCDEDYNDDLANSDGFDEEEAFKDAVKEVIEALGFQFVCDYDASSSYYDLYNADDEDQEEPLGTVRASNHQATRGGIDWSFEPTDKVEAIVAGLEKVISLK